MMMGEENGRWMVYMRLCPSEFRWGFQAKVLLSKLRLEESKVETSGNVCVSKSGRPFEFEFRSTEPADIGFLFPISSHPRQGC
jgi:hypothetical protein